MQNTTTRPVVCVTADGRGVASHAGSRLLADLAEVTGLPAAFGEALGGLRRRRSRHDPGRVLVDVAVMLADGGEAISDLSVLRDQPELFGPVASTATAWRVLDSVDAAVLARLRQARAVARERAWLARAELGRDLTAARAGGRVLPGLVIDVDASLVSCHSEKESAAATFKGGFGYHPLLAFLDNTGEALAGLLRPGNAGSNTAGDHIAVTDLALAQIPDAERYSRPILVRADGAGATRDWLAHLRRLRDQNLDVEFSVGFTMTRAVQTAIDALPKTAWTPAIEANGSVRDGADVAEITGLLDGLTAAGWPDRMRVIVRRERPHPGAQLSLFDQRDGLRYQAFATDTARGQLAHLEARHRAHARVEDRIRQAKDTGIGRFPSRLFALNAAWLRTRAHRDRPDHLDPAPAPRRRPGQVRAQSAALPAPAHRRPHHPRPTPHLHPTGRALDLGPRSRCRVHQPLSNPASASHLNTHTPDHPQPGQRNSRQAGRSLTPNNACTPSAPVSATAQRLTERPGLGLTAETGRQPSAPRSWKGSAKVAGGIWPSRVLKPSGRTS